MLPSNYITATEAIALVIKEQLTIDQVLKDHKDRYEQRNNQVKAWVCIDHTGNKALKGPLQGMIIGVKDIISTLHPSRIS
jgi:Asp-tRNA(Asn)/Glu-tRNA(Gln) amidotransferase A subunit family amidase